MRQYLLLLTVLLLAITNGCSQSKNGDYLLKVYEGEHDEIGAKTGYKNLDGDMVIPMGKYFYCFTDTLKEFAIVLDKNQKCIAIDKNDTFMYEIFWYDNGPDFISDGLFRILKDGKIGYANEKGEIIIEPQFDCAESFENGKAKVTFKCDKTKVDEYIMVKSDEWFYINTKGEKLNTPVTQDKKTTETIEGNFRSTKGVMDDVSCYCFNSGYLTTSSGDIIAVCFEDDEIETECKNITLKGSYKTIKNDPEETSPCPPGEKMIFFVDSYTCK